MTSPSVTPNNPREALWIPAVFVGAMALVVAVNGVMVYFATSTFPGLDTSKAYVNGLAYNETLQDSAAAKALGWQGEASVVDGKLSVVVHDSHGQPVTGLQLHGAIVRPTTTVLDHPLQLTADPQQPGRYLTPLILPASGLWELRLATASGVDGVLWQWNERIMVP
jgi:nitrogen fixation protein FixH